MKYALSLTPSIVTALENYYGVAYPFQKLDVLAVPDYGQAGPPEDLYARYQLDAAGIAARITKLLREHAR